MGLLESTMGSIDGIVGLLGSKLFAVSRIVVDSEFDGCSAILS